MKDIVTNIGTKENNDTKEIIFNVRYYNHPEGYQLQIDQDGKITCS